MTAFAPRAAVAGAFGRVTATLPTLAVHLLGVASFAYPFMLDDVGRGTEGVARAGEAPLLFTLLGVLMIAVALADIRTGRMDVREVALLGVLTGINAALRVPGALGGASLMYILPVLAGAVFGPRFGFLLGASSFGASALLTAGVGPWLPFQMWGLGWVGAGAGVLGRAIGRRRISSRAAIAGLAAYGWLAGIGFGVLLNLWFWPFLAGIPETSYSPGLSPGEVLDRYRRFYVITSLPWDSARALGNVALILVLGRPIVRLFVRFHSRIAIVWRPRPPSGAIADPAARDAPPATAASATRAGAG